MPANSPSSLAADPEATYYGPVDAAIIGAGAGADSAYQQMKGGYYLLRSILADKWQGPEEAKAFHDRMLETFAENADNWQQYQPLREAHPIATSLGEAAPAFLAGRAAGGAALRFNAFKGGAAAGMESILSRQQVPSVTLQRMLEETRKL